MVQFYLLFIVINILVGFVLFFCDASDMAENNENNDVAFLEEKSDSFAKLFSDNSFFASNSFKIVIGFIDVIVSFLMILSPYNGIFLLGDLIPVVIGFAGGFSLLINCYFENSMSELKLNEFIGFVIIDCRKYLGVACIAAAIIHFIIPGVLFL